MKDQAETRQGTLLKILMYLAAVSVLELCVLKRQRMIEVAEAEGDPGLSARVNGWREALDWSFEIGEKG
jgi:hypothetical protein